MAVIIGNMSLVLQNQNAMSAMFSSKMDLIGDSMRAMKVSPKLQNKVLAYYDYLWSRHRLISTKKELCGRIITLPAKRSQFRCKHERNTEM